MIQERFAATGDPFTHLSTGSLERQALWKKYHTKTGGLKNSKE
jgi:hypothetical protein